MRILEFCSCGAEVRVADDERGAGYAVLFVERWRDQHVCLAKTPNLQTGADLTAGPGSSESEP